MKNNFSKLLYLPFLFVSFASSYQIQDVKNITIIGKVYEIENHEKYKLITIDTKYNDKIKIKSNDNLEDIKINEQIIATCIKTPYIKYKLCTIEKSIKNKNELWKRFL